MWKHYKNEIIIFNEDFLLLNLHSLSFCLRHSLICYPNHLYSSVIRICPSNPDSMFIEKLYLGLETLKEKENKNLILFLTIKQNLQAHLTNTSLTNANSIVRTSNCFCSNLIFTKQNPDLNLALIGLFYLIFFLTATMSHLIHMNVLFLTGINELGVGI